MTSSTPRMTRVCSLMKWLRVHRSPLLVVLGGCVVLIALCNIVLPQFLPMQPRVQRTKYSQIRGDNYVQEGTYQGRRGNNHQTSSWSFTSVAAYSAAVAFSPERRSAITKVEPKLKQNNNCLTVHYLLTYTIYFRIEHFLSVYSVMKYIQPCKVMFHYDVMPVDTTWWRKIRKLTPNSEVVRITMTDVHPDKDNDVIRSLNILKVSGGLILTPNIILLPGFPFLNSSSMIVETNGRMIYVSQNRNDTKAIDKLLIHAQSRFMFGFDIFGNDSDVRVITDEDRYYCSNVRANINISELQDKVFVETDFTYSAYDRPFSIDMIVTSKTQWAAIARLTLFDTFDVQTILPNTYHYIWIEEHVRDLNLHEWLSVKSLFHYGKPDKIYFYCNVMPFGPMWENIVTMTSFEAKLLHMPSGDDCLVRLNLIQKESGFFIDFHIILSDDVSLLRLPCSKNRLQEFKYHFQLPNVNNYHSYEDFCKNGQKIPRVTVSCPGSVTVIEVSPADVSSVMTSQIIPDTLFMISDKGRLTMEYLPTMDGFEADLVRYVVYGDMKKFGNSSLYKIPNIIHYIWFGNRTEFYFHIFLCIYSAYINQQPDTIYFHYEHLPRGTWWQALNLVVTLTLVKTDPPTSGLGRPIGIVEHQSDLARLQILQRYGGIYLDTDMFVINSLNPLRTHSFVMAEEQEFSLGNGIILAERTSQFLQLYLQSYADYNGSLWGYNSVIVPFQLMLQHRDLIHLGPRDRILVPDWSNCLKDLWYPDSTYYWRDNFVVHLYCKENVKQFLPNMDKHLFTDRFLTSTFGQIATAIYSQFKANLNT